MVAADTIVALGVIASFYGLLALGMNVKYGHTGLLDFGHVAFFLIGAYGAALFVLPPDQPGDYTKYLFGLDLPWLVAALLAVVIAGVVGAFVALPTLRLREDYLAITVLGISVILQRIVQAESWLVNGPDALRGIPQPLQEFFPLTGGSPVDAVGFLLIAAAIWTVTVYALGQLLEREGGGRGSSWSARIYAVASLQSRAGEEPQSDGGTNQIDSLRESLIETRRSGSPLVAGIIAGVVGAVLLLLSPVGLLVWGTVLSLFTWVVTLIGCRRLGADFTVGDYAVTFLLGLGYMLALGPMYLIDPIGTWLPLTLLAFAVVIGATVYLSRNWERFVDRPFRYGAFTGLWFVFIWYVPLQILGPVLRGQLLSAATTLFNNIVWVLSFSGVEPVIGYNRFLLFLFGSILFLSVHVTDLLVESPFGRVLRAIRNDERVVNSLGKDPFLFKLQSMGLGSALAGLAGVMAGLYYQTLVFTMFAPRVTFIALLMMFLGGIGNNRAMVVGAVLFWAFQTATTQLAGFVAPEYRTRIQALRFVLMGVLFLALLYYRPQGLMGERGRTGVSQE